MTYLLLFWEFFKTGLLSIGGGLATIPFLYDMAARYAWFTAEELTNMLAISESTPGPIGVNMATYVGLSVAGIPGGLIATFALILPAFLIMLLVASALTRLKDNRIVHAMMRVLRPASVGLIAAAALTVLRAAFCPQGGIQWPALALGAVLLAIQLKWKKLHPVVLVALGACAGIALGL